MPFPPATAAAAEALLWAPVAEVLGDGLAGIVSPTPAGTARLQVVYEAINALSTQGMAPSEIRSWWTTQGSLNSLGIDGSPNDILRHERLKDAAKIILRAARSWGDPKAPITPIVWPVRTLVLLDVDGVLLPFSDGRRMDRASFTPLDFYEPPRPEPDRYYFSRAVITAINSWAATPGVEVVWLTSWGELAPDLAVQLGLPIFQSLAIRSSWDLAFQRPWKSQAVYEHVSEYILPGHPTRLLWLDDRDAEYAGARLRGMQNPGMLTDSLIIEPQSHLGLTATDLARATAFISAANTPSLEALVTNHPEPQLPTLRTMYLPTRAGVATAIREGRAAAGTSQIKLAAAAGVSRFRVRELEAGRMRWNDLGLVIGVLEELGITTVGLPSMPAPGSVDDVDIDAHLARFETKR